MLRYFRTPGLRVTHPPKPLPRPVKAVKTRLRDPDEWAYPRNYPHVGLARRYIFNACLPLPNRLLEASAEGHDMTKEYQEAMRLQQDTLFEPEYQKLARWADQWGSKVAGRCMMLEYGQPVLPWLHVCPILQTVYKDRKMTDEDWQKEEESFNRLTLAARPSTTSH
ncbi:hypothetical protein JCM10295v2_002918 [Rhodotorula toruloides]